MIQYRQKNPAMRFILNTMVFVCPMGAKAMTINVGIGQLSIFRIMVVVAVLGGILCGLKGERIVYERKGNAYSTRFMFVWFAYAVLSLIWMNDYDEGVKNLYFLLIGVIVVFLLLNYYVDKRSIETAFFSMNMGIFVQSIIGWYEVISRDYRYVSEYMQYQYGVRSKLRIPIAMSGNPNDFAMLMFIGVMLSYFLWIKGSRRIEKVIAIVLLINYSVLLVMTVSRGLILALGIAIVFILVSGGRKKIGLLVALICLLLCNPYVIEFILEQFDRTAQVVTSDNTRLQLINSGFSMCIETFGLGVGCGQGPYWLRTKYPEIGIEALHNWWIEILACYGIAIFVGYIIFYLKLFSALYCSYKRTNDIREKGLSNVLCAFMLGYIIGGISSSSNITNECLWVFWAICISYQGMVIPIKKMV